MSEDDDIGTGAKAYREKAHVLRKEADDLSDAEARTGLLFTALYYEALADQVERNEHGSQTRVQPDTPSEDGEDPKPASTS